MKQIINVKNGIETEHAKKIHHLIKDSKIEVTAAIQGEVVRGPVVSVMIYKR
jgi:cyclic-di-GMP-binding protein